MTQTFGDARVARTLWNYFGGEQPPTGGKRTPPGFSKLGAGAYRAAYLHKESQLVYKIGCPISNLQESSNSRRLIRKSTRSLTIDLRIPRTRTYSMPALKDWQDPGNIIVQEYAKGARFAHCDRYLWEGEVFSKKRCSCELAVCAADALAQIFTWSGLEDIHCGNILVDQNNTFWFVDMAD